ncbi:hypothetical protein D5R81_19355, partial [Parashewanella spongiae]
MALTSTSNTISSAMHGTSSPSDYAGESNRKRSRTDEGSPVPKRLCTTTTASERYFFLLDQELPRNLQNAMNRKGIKILPAFIKLLSKVEIKSEEERTEYSKKLTIFFINISDAKVKDTGFFTSMIHIPSKIKKFFRFSDKHITQVAKTKPMKSLSSIFRCRGFPNESKMERFNKLLKLPQLLEEGTLNLPQFKSLSSLFNGHGLPDESEMKRLVKLLELPQLQESGTLNLPLLKSLSSIFHGRGLPDEAEMTRFVNILELPQLQEGGRLSMPRLKSLSSIFNCRGLPDEVEMTRFIKLLELPPLQEGGRLSLRKFKSLSSIFNGRGLPNEVEMKRFIELLKLPQLHEGGRLSLPLLQSLSSIFCGRGIPEETAMTRFVNLLELPQLQEDGRLSLPRFKSLSSILGRRGLPDEKAMARFIMLLELPQLQEGGSLNLPLLKSLSSIFSGRGLPDESEMKRFIDLLELPQLQEGGRLSLPLHKSLLSIFHQGGLPNEATMMRFIELLKMPQLHEDGRLNLPLFKLLLVKVKKSQPDDTDSWFNLLEHPALQQNGRFHLLRLACVFEVFSLSPKQEEVTKLFSLLSIDGQPDDKLLQLCIHEWKQSSLLAVEKAFSCSLVAKLITHFHKNNELISIKALALTVKGEPELLDKLNNHCSLSSIEIMGLTFPCVIESHQGILNSLGKICFANGQLGLKLFFANAPRPEGSR